MVIMAVSSFLTFIGLVNQQRLYRCITELNTLSSLLSFKNRRLFNSHIIALRSIPQYDYYDICAHMLDIVTVNVFALRASLSAKISQTL